MKKVNGLKVYTHEEMLDKHVGKVGTQERETFETELQMDLLGEILKRIRIERHMNQTQLGEMIGVKKSQVSRIEKNGRNVTIATFLKFTSALKLKVKITVDSEELVTP
jgi:HTH-type transcriptional regulator/antitoxin HipB